MNRSSWRRSSGCAKEQIEILQTLYDEKVGRLSAAMSCRLA